MSLKIEVFVDRDEVACGNGGAYLAQALSAIGYARQSGPQLAPPYTGETAQTHVGGPTGAKAITNTAEQASAQIVTEAEQAHAEEPARRKRRTKAEMEADRAAEQAQISTGEERVGPGDTPEDAAQDKADEQAEVEAKRDPKAPLTIDDVKAAMMAYKDRYGMAATQEDGVKIFAEALGKPPEGQEYWKLSVIPDTQEALQKVVATWEKATELNPLKRERV